MLGTGLPEVEITHYLLAFPTAGGTGANSPSRDGQHFCGKNKGILFFI